MPSHMLQPYEEESWLDWPFKSFFPSMKTFAQSSGVSIWEEEGDIVVEASLPGIKNDEVDLTFEKSMLTICAQKKEEKEDTKKKYYQKAEHSFVYKLSIPGELDENIEPQASLDNGVLQIRFKKHKRSEPKKIQIR